jgi:hypothetical protein
MIFFGCGLKSCTHTHTKYDIGPKCIKLKQGAYDGAIYLLIYRFSALGTKIDWLTKT